MYISYNWLKELVDIKLTPEDLAQQLTRVGLAVEGIEKKGDDFVLDIDLTSNRPDCLSHLGIAREIGTITNYELRITNTQVKDQRPKTEDQRPKSIGIVTIEDQDLCNRFTARIIRGVKIGPSPEWLVKRLEAVGERSINNVADITNFVMHELGNPMHSFDLNKLTDKRIVVRKARTGETIKTLDDVERLLDETMLAICDAEKPVAVAGIMGGLDSSITEETTDVLLEVAHFKRENIRQTSRNLKLSTEASHRFERGVDIENVIRASNRAADLICELAGGTAEEIIDVYPVRFTSNEIESNDIQYSVKRLTGLDVDVPTILQTLHSLGIKSGDQSQNADRKSQVFYSPSWRHDIAIEEDLVEEVARIYGYENIGEELPPAFGAGELQPNELRKFNLRQTMINTGFDEAISYSFIDAKTDGQFELVPNLTNENLEEKYVTLQNSIIEGAARMRPTLLAGLLGAVRTNFNQGTRDVKLFELGKVFSAANGENELPNERELLALALTGNEILQNKAMPLREFDFYDAKGAFETAVEAINLAPLKFRAAEIRHLRKGKAAEILLGGSPVGTIGQLSDEIAQSYKFKQPVFVAEVDLQTLFESKQQEILYRPLPNFPSSIRDISLLIKRNVTFAAIKNAIEAENYELLRKIDFVDAYEGKGVADDERSLTVRLVYRSDERTLIDEEVERVHAQILERLEANTGAKLRF